ncbi:MAG: transcriptional repressor [Hydrogenothermaceae bacterium]|nr:transcriptional repressor [Hydrogenothermaceae bacterium]
MKPQSINVEKVLRDKGFKLTKQRVEIFKEILGKRGHFEVEDIVHRIRRKGLKASRATVYRTLNILKEVGLLNEVVKFGNKTYYEIGTKEHHDHLICLNCGKFIEFHDNRIEEVQDQICGQFNFKPLYHRLEIYGICEDCNKNIKTDR